MSNSTPSSKVLRRLPAVLAMVVLLLPAMRIGSTVEPVRAALLASPPALEAVPESSISWPAGSAETGVASRSGDYDPAQLAGSTGDVRPDRHGPQRTDPAEGIPKHAYSPFDERNNREYPCPPGGCEFQKGQVLVKLAPQSQLRALDVQGAWTGDISLNSVLAAQGVQRLEPVFPQARAPKLSEMVISPDGKQMPKPDLTRWYRATLAEDKADVKATAGVIAKAPGIALAEPNYLRKPVGGPALLEGEGMGSFPSPIDPGEGEGPLLSATSATMEIQGTSGIAPWGSDYGIRPGLATPTDPLYSQQWHLPATNVPQAWAYLESLGLPPGGSRDVVVAVIDTGVDYNHPDLAANIWTNSREIAGNGVDDDGNGYVDDVHGMDAINNSGNPLDDHGHGTHVAGIIASQANNGLGGVGVAYNVQIMPIKAAQYSGVLASSDIAEAIYYAVAQGADVINMSFGGYARSSLEEDALTVAFGQAVLVAAAGNDGKVNLPCPLGRDMYPAAYNWVLGVMASSPGGGLAGFSNKDCIPYDTHEYELMAPGVDVWSTLPREQYAAWDGTSMAAPVVAGIAALARTKWSDKDVYSSRFIMGQIAANAGPVANAYAALAVTPKPELRYLEHWLFDTSAQSAVNDDDGVVDAGETIELAIVVRNHWGKADPVTVTLQAWANGAFQPDPYVTMITDTVDYGAIGSFNWDDNGLIYDGQGVITGVRHPFRFTVPVTTPNDHVIPFLLTMTAHNGLDPTDTTTYTFQSRFNLIVQRGRELPRIISADMVLTKDYLWIVPGEVYIVPTATVTVTEGTQVQWGKPTPADPYFEPKRAYISVGGKLLIQGTYEEPVELFPMAIYNPYGRDVYINNTGELHVKYTKVDRPEWGMYGIYYGPNSVDHSYLFGDVAAWDTGYSPSRSPWSTTNTIIELWQGTNGFGAGIADTVLFYAKSASKVHGLSSIKNSVFLQNNTQNYVWQGVTTWSNCLVDEAQAVAATQSTGNAILSKYWDPNINHWMRVYPYYAGRGACYEGLAYNFWGTTSTTLIDAAIRDWNDSLDLAHIVYQPILTVPATTTYPFVWDVALSTASSPRTAIVGAEEVTFTVSFNRDMDSTVQPQVSFGPDAPVTDYTIHPVNGGWQDPRTWAGTFNVNPITGDGYQLIRVAGARAADDPWLVTGNDAGRFRFEIITSGSEAMNLQATGGEGYVDLAWTQNDFDLLAGFNLYRATTQNSSYTRLNSALIPSDRRSFRDTSVQPGQPYYYKFTIVKSDMSETDFSNVATATPIDTVPPAIGHTPLTSAQPGLPLTLYADVTDNVGVQDVTLFFRPISTTSYISRTMTHTSGNRYSATIEGSRLASPGVEYYVEATDGVSTVRSGRPEYPYQIEVDDRPTVTAVSPNRGPASGGTLVTIAGTNFKPGASATFGGAVAGNVTVVSGNQITATTPGHFPATVDVSVVNTDTQSGSLLGGFTYESDTAGLSLPDASGEQHAVLQVPINLANVQGLAAASLWVTFDSSVLSGRGARLGTLTPGWSLAVNSGVGGQIRLSLASPGGTVSGSGSLAILEFEVIGSPGMTSTLHFASVYLNDGSIPTQIDDGFFSVNLVYKVSGAVRFWNGSAGVPGALLTLEGDRVYTGVSDPAGAYTVTGVPAGAYTLIPSKSNGAGGISAYDASLVLQHDVGLITLSGYAATAADVNRNGLMNSMDAYYILQKAVDLITLPFPGAGRVWDFSPAGRSYPDLGSDQTGQDFTAVLLGDVSGNWSASGVQSLAGAGLDPVTLAVLGGQVTPSGLVTATLWLDTAGAQIHSMDVDLLYSAAEATLVSAEPGPLASGLSYGVNSTQAGRVRLGFAGALPVTESGALLALTFQMTDPLRGGTFLSVVRAAIDEGAVPGRLVDARLGKWRLYLPYLQNLQTVMPQQ